MTDVHTFRAEFDQFWLHWPRRVAKADALKAWLQTQPSRPPLADVLLAIDAFQAWRARLSDSRQFVPAVPYPATWLRGERWSDEFDVSPARCAAPPAPEAAERERRQADFAASEHAARISRLLGEQARQRRGGPQLVPKAEPALVPDLLDSICDEIKRRSAA